MPPPLPTFLIIGAAKSGTSSLWHYLREHPDVFVAERKEINFFDQDWVYARGIEWYATHFADARDVKAIGEATPAYLSSAEAPARIAFHLPAARLVAILRNPIDRAYSHYLHTRYYALEQRSFAEAVTEERRSPEGRAWPFYLDRGRYMTHIDRVLEHFPREQLLVMLLDDVERDPVEAFRALCRHIGIDETIVPGNVGQVTNAYREARLEPVFRRIVRPKVWERLPQRVRPAIARVFTREGRSYAPMEARTRSELGEYFSEDNVALGRWLGRDLSMWR